MKKRYSNWMQVAFLLGTAIALYAVGAFWFSILAVGIAVVLTIEECVQRGK